MGCLLSKHRQIDVYSKAELAHSSVVPFEDHSSVHNPIADPATAVDQWLHSRGHSHYTAAICDAFSQAGFPQAEWLLELQQMSPIDLDLFLEMLAKSPESMQAEQVEQFPRHPAEFDSEEAKRSIQQGQSNHETEGRDAARATVDEWSENEGDQELGEHIDVVFSGDGKLGLVFRTGVVPLVVARIQNIGLAANMPEVQPGMALTAVQGSGLMGLSYAEILDRIKIAGRPLSLSFTQSEPVAEPEPERGWLLPKCQASCACCSAVLPLSKPRARDHGTQWAHHQLTDSCAQLRCCYPRGCRPRSELTQLWRATLRTSPPSELALCKYKIRLYY